MEPYVRRLTRVLDRRLGWHRSPLKLIARMVRAAIETRTTNLAEWAVPIKPQVQADSTDRRIQAFFEKFTLDYEDLGRFLLDLVPTDPPHAVVLDRTEWHFDSKAMNALVAGVAHGGIAYPVAWTVLDHEGGSGTAEQIEVVGRLTDVLAPGDIRARMADREFTGADWIEALADRDIPFVLRLKSDRRVARPDGPALPVRMFVRPLSEDPSRLLDGLHRIGSTGDASVQDASARPVHAQILGKRLDDQNLLALAARGVDLGEAIALYRRRWDIETLFAALKSKGFGLEETGPAAPDRIRSLLGIVALAYLWARLVGEKRRAEDGPPRRCAHGYRAKSRFRYGLDRLREILLNAWRMQAGLRRRMQALIDPDAFLSSQSGPD